MLIAWIFVALNAWMPDCNQIDSQIMWDVSVAMQKCTVYDADDYGIYDPDDGG